VVMGGSFESLPGAQVTAESVVMKVPGPAWRILRSAGNLWREHRDWVARLLAGLLFSLLTWLSAWGLFHAFPGLQGRTEGRLGREWGMNLFAGVFGAIVACALSVLLVISI